jgi:DNA segregation ATPase FtsK/SpoIIIE, S-DNA-T family
VATTQKKRSGTPAKRRGASAPRRSRLRDLVGQAFDGHGHDAWGMVLIGAGLVVALAVYVDLSGPAGRTLATGIGAVLGLGRFLVPPALIALGCLLIRGPREDAESALGMLVGSGLLALASAGVLQVTRGASEWSADAEVLSSAGGIVGAVVAVPLENLVDTAGALVVLAVLAVVGIVLVTHVPLRVMADRTASSVRPVGGSAQRVLRSLFELRSGTGADEGDHSDRAAGSHDAAAGPGAAGTVGEPRVGDSGPTITVGGATAVFDQDGADDPSAGEIFDLGDPDEQAAAELAATAAADADADPDAGLDDRPLDGDPADADADANAKAGEQLEMPLPPGARKSAWKLPKANLLERSSAREVDRRLVEEDGRRLERALAEHGVETRLVGMVVGPTVTRYELELGPGVKVARVTSLHKDIAYAMASPDVRILAPIPGKQALGVEVPNSRREIVTLGDLLSSEEYRRASQPLDVALGRDISGRTSVVDITTMPHVLIAGATGAGKSSCINSIITSLLMRATPDQLRMILIDPKRVELGQYNRLPHLLTQVVTDPKKAANALAWAVKEMERRYDLLSEVGVRDVGGYNASFDRGDLQKLEEELVLSRGEEWAGRYPRLPYIVVVVDELNDLMMVAARDVEESICRIAQMARAVGIHLLIATQRPSVNVITGVIKANVPTRLAFAVSSLADSRVILDQPGAERLVGKGDMLYLSNSSNILQRIQGSWVTEDEVRKVVAHWRRQTPEIDYVEGIEGDASSGTTGGGGRSSDDDDDDLLMAAMELVVETQLGSTSMLQRKLKVGFARAGRIMDLLEQRGVVGPSEGSKARSVLMTPEELAESRTQSAS